MKTIRGCENISLEKFDEVTWQQVDKCRQMLGYQDSPDWECPYNEHGESFRKQSAVDGNPINCFVCYPCLVKESVKWHSLGLPIPVSVMADRLITAAPVQVS